MSIAKLSVSNPVLINILTVVVLVLVISLFMPWWLAIAALITMIPMVVVIVRA